MLSRLLLVFLVLVGIGVIARFASSDQGGRAYIAVGTDEPGRLRHHAFAVERPVHLAVSAVGSFEADSVLAAYGWVVRREDRAVVWQMTPGSVRRGRGALAYAEDTLRLGPGTYDAYFTTLGDPLLDRPARQGLSGRVARALRPGGQPWHSDRSKWRLDLDPVDRAERAAVQRLSRGDRQPAPPEGGGLLWAGGPAGDDAYLTYGFEVHAPAALRVLAQGQFRNGDPADYGWIDDLSTGRRVWAMTPENTAHAGGSVVNRRFEGAVRLRPGVYRAVYQTDGAHAEGRWRANPPLDPAAYGLFLYADDPAAVGPFDPWDRLPRLAEIAGVGNRTLRSASFTLADSLRVWAYAVGEIGERDARYDHAWLLRDGERVWEMSRRESRHAGGAERNRVAEAYLALGPGAYTLHVETDGSHAPGDWQGDPPHHPERWGVTLFVVSEGFAPGSVAVELHGEGEVAPEAPEVVEEPVELPIRLAPLGDDARVARTFVLEEEAPLRIHALGEIIRSQRYDYGWIEDVDGAVVWEMTGDNTEPAGGTDKNRRFRGTVPLPAGTYTVHFVTDDSHAFGSFQSPPDDPSAWGISLEWAEEQGRDPED